MLWRRRVADDAAPAFSTIVRTVHAALIGGPHLSRFCAGAEQRRDCAGWLRPAVADALPAPLDFRSGRPEPSRRALAREAAIQAAIRAATHVRGVRSGRR